MVFGLANYRLAACILAEDAEASLQHLDSYLDFCVTTKDLKGQGQACSALAAAYQTLGMQKSRQISQKFLDIAKKTDNLSAQAEACCNLGVIHNRRGELTRPCTFPENFEYSRSIVSSGNGTGASSIMRGSIWEWHAEMRKLGAT